MMSMRITSFLRSVEIRVHLSTDALIACEVRRTWWRKAVVTRKTSFELLPGGRASAMAALQDWISEVPAKRSIVWIIGPTEAQYFVLPWSPGCVDRVMRDAYARAHFEQLYERDAGEVAFCFAEQSASEGQLVSCISSELHAELVAHALLSKCDLGGIKPSIFAVWDRFREVLETEQGALCVDDGHLRAIVQHDKRRIQDIVVRPGGRSRAGLASRTGAMRRFSNAPVAPPISRSSVDLNLPTQRGFAAAQDSAYAFALCGAL